MDTLKVIELRRSIRSYQPKTVEADKIEQLLAAGSNAPQVGFFHISVIENTDVLKEINNRALYSYKNSGDKLLMGRAALEGFEPLYGAPVLFLFSAPNGNPYNTANTSCAATNITIAATALELGSCYIVAPLLGIKGNRELSEKIGIPFGFSPICGVIVGYSASNAVITPKPTTINVNYCR
jgi:nitroreductase